MILKSGGQFLSKSSAVAPEYARLSNELRLSSKMMNAIGISAGDRLVRMKVIRGIVFFLFWSVSVFGQEFEVATIKPSAQDAQTQTTAGIHIDGSMVRYSALSLKLYLGLAYGLKNYQISAPEWMASGRWDISAKLPDGSDAKQIPKMLQVLLRDRFRMKMHRETRELPVYGLILGKGELKLKASPAAPTAVDESPGQSVNVAAGGNGAGTTVSYGNGSYLTLADNKFEGKKLPMTIMADALARFADRPVVDMTNLKGDYDFTMQFSPEDFRAMMIRAAVAQGTILPPDALKLAESASDDTLFDAVTKLGLKLELRKAPIEVLVIDDALKMPTEN
jgi:uncharacterized protein (TIGR03435 family)